MPLRVAMSGCSHWHRKLYLEPLRALPDTALVAVADPDVQVAERVARENGCDAFTNLDELCIRARPDFVFVLGRHCDMPADAALLADRKIAFAVEKPAGRTAADVRQVAAAAARTGTFAAVPFVFRQSDLFAFLSEHHEANPLTTASFRFIAGPPSRYLESGCAWMLEPQLSGGGCTINLSVHFIDLVRALTGGELQLRSAFVSSAAFGLPVEDYSVLSFEAGGVACSVETGYLFPAPTSVFDMRFSLRFGDAYVIATDGSVEVTVGGQASTARAMGTTNVSAYPAFVADVLTRVRRGDAPAADLDDLAGVMTLVDQAYALAGARKSDQEGVTR